VIGRQVSHFYVIRSLGSGGMGVVYEAQDTRLPRSVALKFLKPALSKNVDAVRRFKREARLASSLNHPNICTILDIDESDGQSFIAMELLHGRSLKDRLASSVMSLTELLDVGIQVADALATAHGQGIMHRDITPGNIFLTDAGPVKVLDFGLAKYFAVADDDCDVSDDLTQPGVVVGTVHYMAPEQFTEGVEVDHRCDLFSCGAVLYQMATGARPFEAKSKHDVIGLIRDQPHIPLRRLAPQHPAHLERIIDRLLAKCPRERYGASQLRDELQELRRQSAGRLDKSLDHPKRGRTSIAVLPFEIIGEPGPYSQQFREGLAEDISGRLTSVEGIRVAPRTSTRHVAGQSIRDIGSRLNVQFVLEGSVQQAGDRVRVIANLIHAAREQPVRPAVTMERRFDDLLSVQDDVARHIVDSVSESLGGALSGWHTDDAQAQHAFKRGQHHWSTARFSGGWLAALEQFQYAVERDDRFALAHVALASVYEFLGFYCLMKPNLAFREARRAIDRALELDDTIAAAHNELALIKFGGDWDWDGAEQAFRRALQLDPNSFFAHITYGWLLMLLGREEAALREAKQGHDLAPTSRYAAAARAQVLYLSKRYDEAIELCNQCLASSSDYVFATSLRGQCYELKRMFPEAVADLTRTVAVTRREPFYLGMLGHCYGKAGMHPEALDLLGELDHKSRQVYVPPQCYVYIYAGLGQPAKALEYQEKAYEDGASPFNYLVPSIRDLYALDPHHKERLEQMRLIL
jgi:serine/threonine protein kinase/tetratricopeptide (TPR) repeat protein